MAGAVFVAPFLMEATLRFIAAAAALPGVRLGLVTQEPEEAVPHPLRRDLAGHYRIDDALDAGQVAHAVSAFAHHLGSVERRISYPLIVKPIVGAGSADTFRTDSPEQLASILPALRGVAQVSVEEFIDGEEVTFDTICANGVPLFENICWYRPRPLIARSLEWISPITVALRA